MGRFQELLRAVNTVRLLGAIGRSGGDLTSVADLVDNLLDSPQMEACVRRFRSQPGGAALMDGRYPPLQPDLDALATLPPGSLGHDYAQLIRGLGYDPEFFRQRPLRSDAHWLTQRIATTHDIHHVVSGFGTSPAGESGVLAITALQIGFPAYVLLTTAGPLAAFRLQPERYAELSGAVAHGLAIGRRAACLACARWEEGWELPVQEWRRRLCIDEPADPAPWGLAAGGAAPAD